MGDYAKSIAILNLRSGGLGMLSILRELNSMAEKSLDMLHCALKGTPPQNPLLNTMVPSTSVMQNCTPRL
jgi:hypothetical protein